MDQYFIFVHPSESILQCEVTTHNRYDAINAPPPPTIIGFDTVSYQDEMRKMTSPCPDSNLVTNDTIQIIFHYAIKLVYLQ
jgi:hypothetical protein